MIHIHTHTDTPCRVIKDNIPGQDAIDLQHLRRFARPRFMPEHVVGQRDLVKEMHAVRRTWDDATAQTVFQNSETNSWEWINPAKKSAVDKKAFTLYLLVCPSHLISLEDLYDLMSKFPPFCSDAESWAFPLEIKKATVPRQPPTKPEQAEEWSRKYWPTFYRKTNPFGAHPGTIAKAESDLKHPLIGNLSVPDALALAERAGEETYNQGYSQTVTGCVIVERVNDKTQVIAAAGDARYKPMPNAADVAGEATGDHPCNGNPMCHTVMRAIGMVGRKRLRVASTPNSRNANKGEKALAAAGLGLDQEARDAFFLDLPLNDFEQQYFKRDNLMPDGYLCLKLEVFLTHEPCVMCSMALVHSRVGRVIFKHRMPKTGGLTAEVLSNDTGPVGLGYGLCWRKELNWQFMCWEYTPVDASGKPTHSSYPGKDEEETKDTESVPVVAHGAVSSRHRKKKKNGRVVGEKSPGDGAQNNMTNANPYVNSFARVHV
jgi:tRNA-specific adenosine deaminase 3